MTYPGSFDVLAAGDARFDQVLHQGIRPVWSLDLARHQAADPLHHRGARRRLSLPERLHRVAHHDADVDRTSMQPFNEPSLTLDEARLSSGEVFINGQHDPSNRPKPIARAYVDVTPAARPQMDFLATFDDGAAWEPFTKWTGQQRLHLSQPKWAIDTSGCTDNFTFGPVLGQFVLGFADGGSSCNVSMTPKKCRRSSPPTASCTCACRRTSPRPAGATRRS